MSKISQSVNFIKNIGSFYLCLGLYLCSTQYHSAQEEAPSISRKRLVFCQVKKSHKMFPLTNLDNILCLHFNNSLNFLFPSMKLLLMLRSQEYFIYSSVFLSNYNLIHWLGR